MRKSIIIGFILAIVATSCVRDKQYPYKTSDFRTDLRKQLDKLVSENQLPSKDTVARNFLEKECTKEELLQILNCENPLLRIVAYRTLVNKKEKDYFNILLTHLNDTAKVTWWYYEDAADVFAVSDLMIRKAEDRNKLTQKEKEVLVDSVLLKHPYLRVSTWMIQDINPQERYYSIISKRATVRTERCGEQMSACYALAKFKKNEDIQLLKEKFIECDLDCSEWAFKGIIAFPDTAFLPVLTRYFEKEIRKKKQHSYDELKYFCQAVAQYRNQKSLAILKSLTKKETYPDSWYLPQNKENVFKAIQKFPSPLYDKIYRELKLQIHDLSPDFFESRKTW
ncbi:MAG: hypothetical protein PHT07_21340 [Paludibacter sp.]|nr:hypothetical protein [Paludibacter sp.]